MSGIREATPITLSDEERSELERIDKSALAIGIPTRVRDRKHLDGIREQPCVMSRKPGPSDPAHISVGNNPGKGPKAGDNHVVSLNHFEHLLQHEIGEPMFWADDLDQAQKLATDLYDISGDHFAGVQLIQTFWRDAERGESANAHLI